MTSHLQLLCRHYNLEVTSHGCSELVPHPNFCLWCQHPAGDCGAGAAGNRSAMDPTSCGTQQRWKGSTGALLSSPWPDISQLSNAMDSPLVVSRFIRVKSNTNWLNTVTATSSMSSSALPGRSSPPVGNRSPRGSPQPGCWALRSRRAARTSRGHFSSFPRVSPSDPCAGGLDFFMKQHEALKSQTFSGISHTGGMQIYRIAL